MIIASECRFITVKTALNCRLKGSKLVKLKGAHAGTQVAAGRSPNGPTIWLSTSDDSLKEYK